MYLGTFFTFSLSAIIATGAESGLDVGKTVEAALPNALALPVLLVMTLGLLPANLVNLFVGPAVLQTVGLRLNRLQGVLATALVGTPIAVTGIFQPEFGSTFKIWMLALVMWLTPWLVITMTDYFIVHRGHYSDMDLFTRNGVARDFFMPGIVAWVVGLACLVALREHTALRVTAHDALLRWGRPEFVRRRARGIRHLLPVGVASEGVARGKNVTASSEVARPAHVKRQEPVARGRWNASARNRTPAPSAT